MGLEALLGPRVKEAGEVGGALVDGVPAMLKLSQLQTGKYQPRTRMDEGSLYELAESIKAQGVMQPILVRPVGAPEAGRYEIIAGERRSRAAKLAGMEDIPVLVRVVPDEAAAAMALIENIQREDLNPLEEAQGIARLVTEFQLTHDQAAQAVGRSRSAASNLMRLLNLTKAVQQLLMAGDIDMGHARALLPLEGAQQVLCANEIIAKKLSVREAEKLVARQGQPARSAVENTVDKPSDLRRIEQELSDVLTSPVSVRIKKRTAKGEQGEIAIGFGSLDELNGLLARLGLPSR